MIQDINPHILNNQYSNILPTDKDKAIIFKDNNVLIKYDLENKKILIPSIEDIKYKEYFFLFNLDNTNYFLFDSIDNYVDKYEYVDINEIRKLFLSSNEDVFSIYSAYHLYQWYKDNKYCGRCTNKLIHDNKIRALRCPKCANIIFPRINPAVIVGVINKDKLLLTKYKNGFSQNALVAGFVEFAETLEETVKREVKEEVGLNVKNIRYYKSQPWGIALDILVGFYCEVDGDDTIKLDNEELKSAIWTSRQDIILQDKEYSLTNEMMKKFKDGEI